MIERAEWVDAQKVHFFTTNNSTTDCPSGYRCWLTCRCGWVSEDYSGNLPDRARIETGHRVNAVLPVIVGAVTDELRGFAEGQAIAAHALRLDSKRGWLDLIHLLDAIDRAAGREATA